MDNINYVLSLDDSHNLHKWKVDYNKCSSLIKV